ncbi:uncharacterized protein LOC128234843 isoform X2 [Mya arenaria]|uniref:uncharacterized protein LOC128234843 isoform X2 n=1 Tax=Mya arenaria TaxID=6604 RepID=UPI0022DF6F2A|nr:uncharacterized protein LOC128234843 isoform X2 [Mya arenaria]
MAVPFSNTKLRVPKGFQNILEGLAREILRSQPENPFEFGAKYFEQLMRVREETGHDPAVHGARLEDRFYNNDSFKSPSVDPSSPQQQDAALTIQTNYRKHTAEQQVENMKEDEAAEKIQAGFRGYQDRQKFADLKEPEKGGKQEEEEEVDIDLNDPDVEKAAVKIQAGFKGFKARQEIKEMKEKAPEPAPSPEPTKTQAQEEEEVDIDLNDPEVGAAALKIQAGFRGHQTRQQLKDKQAQSQEPKTDEPKEAEALAEEEEVDIDLNDPEVGAAALKIQAGFRGHQTRQQIKQQKESKTETSTQETDVKKEEDLDLDMNDPELAGAAVKIQSGFRGHMARKEIQAKKESKQTDKSPPEPVKEEKKEEVDIDLNDPDTEKAALKIQAGFKGYQTRKDLKSKKEAQTQQVSKEDVKAPSPEATEEKKDEVDIDLKDPEVEKAAVKIQAGFKGYKTRQEIKAKIDSSETQGEEKADDKSEEKTDEAKTDADEKTEGETVDIDLNDPEVAQAATKIQAGFKGYKTRQELKQKKDSEEN